MGRAGCVEETMAIDMFGAGGTVAVWATRDRPGTRAGPRHPVRLVSECGGRGDC